MTRGLTIFPVAGMPEVRPKDDLVGLVIAALAKAKERLADGDVVVIAQKVVSKSEGRIVKLAEVEPSERAKTMAAEGNKDPRQLEVVLRETKTILRWERGVLICETHHGFVCANAGVDRSNAGQPDAVVLLPLDPDASAGRIRDEIARRASARVAVVVTDTFGRAWREGHMGQTDPEGYELRVTEIAVADEVAGAAELVMGKLDRCPVAIVRGVAFAEPSETARDYVRPAARDLFR